MSTQSWDIEIGRVVVTGAASRGLEANEIRAVVERTLADRLAIAELPTGRSAIADVRISVTAAGGAVGVADAVSSGVVSAIRGPVRHG